MRAYAVTMVVAFALLIGIGVGAYFIADAITPTLEEALVRRDRVALRLDAVWERYYSCRERYRNLDFSDRPRALERANLLLYGAGQDAQVYSNDPGWIMDDLDAAETKIELAGRHMDPVCSDGSLA